MPYESGAGGSGIDENIVAFLPTGIVCKIPQGPGGPGVRDCDVSESTVTNIPGDALAMSIGYCVCRR